MSGIRAAWWISWVKSGEWSAFSVMRVIRRYEDGEFEWIDSTKEKYEFLPERESTGNSVTVKSDSCPKPSETSQTAASLQKEVSSQKNASLTQSTPQKSTPQKQSTPSKRKRDDEDAYVPKEEESSDDSIDMDVESSEDEPVRSTLSRSH